MLTINSIAIFAKQRWINTVCWSQRHPGITGEVISLPCFSLLLLIAKELIGRFTFSPVFQKALKPGGRSLSGIRLSFNKFIVALPCNEHADNYARAGTQAFFLRLGVLTS